MLQYSIGVFKNLLNFLNNLKGLNLDFVVFKRTYQDGPDDYWSYEFALEKKPAIVFKGQYPYQVKFTENVKDLSETYTADYLWKTFKKDSKYKDVVDVATILLASKSYKWYLYEQAF